jgi:hypothetical protein
MNIPFGINLGFAVKRLPAASEWARFVREQLNLELVQFSFDLIDPFMPLNARLALAAQVRQAAERLRTADTQRAGRFGVLHLQRLAAS